MGLFPFILLLALLSNLSVSVYIVAKNSQRPFNRAYLLYSGATSLWLLGDVLTRSFIPEPWMTIVHKATSVSWLLVGVIFLNFCYAVLQRNRDATWTVLFIAAMLAVVTNLTTNLITNGYTTYSWGTDISRTVSFKYVTFLVVIMPVGLGVLLLLRELQRRRFSDRSLLILAVGSTALLTLGTVTDVVIPSLALTAHVPPLASLFSCVLSMFLFWAIIRHGFLFLDLETAAVDLFHHISDGVLIVNHEGLIQLSNRAAERLFAGRNISKENVEELFDDYDSTTEYDDHETTTKGTKTVVSISQSPLLQSGVERGKILIVRDLTQRQHHKEELIKHQRIESIGLLAGGIAHDFNNILTAILSNITLVKMNLAAGDPSLDLLNDAESSTYRARLLTQQLLTFSKGGDPIRKAVSTQKLVKSALQFSLSGSNVICSFKPPRDLWNVHGDEGQLIQVINNLVINAIQAMPSGGEVSVVAANRVVVDETLVEPGAYIELQISDQGMGIPAENLQRIFDPYFTTKSRGSGLGLASTYSIIRKHGGLIDVCSEVGVGTTFRILLPATEGELRTSNIQTVVTSFGVKGKVLLMDDEEPILRAGSRILRKYGYKPITAKDGEQALALYASSLDSDDPIDVVIMDLTIPGGMGGKEAIRRLLEIDPRAKAIVSSGYSNDPVMGACEEHGFRAVVTKPYDIKEFIATIDRVRREGRGSVSTGDHDISAARA